MARVVVIDNYDSFTYNLVQALEQLGAQCDVFLNDAITGDQVLSLAPTGILISPGPCSPNEAGVSIRLITEAAASVPLLGVCLGHQAIVQALGGKIVRATRLMHGKTSPIHHDGRTLYKGLTRPFTATRYHSLIVERETLPACLEVSAWTAEGEIMGIRHRTFALEGVQFHPESFLTAEGPLLLANWLRSLSPQHDATHAHEAA